MLEGKKTVLSSKYFKVSKLFVVIIFPEYIFEVRNVQCFFSYSSKLDLNL